MSSFGNAPAPIVQSSSTQTPLTPDQQFANLQLMQQVKGGASWFYWIAGLSVVNTIAAVSGTSWRFILGLGITQVADAVAHEVGGAGTIAAIIVDAIAIGFFVLMGFMSGKAAKWAFIVGMVAFALDGVLTIIGQDYISAAFHAYALFRIYVGFSAVGKLKLATT